ncbi:hypothetical protein C8Q73DRAFT_636490 [Cubamyces lactineus]|nr:hypothetical protein C8Q73DRAFT_636490 [Cubamyces lactineus]
MSVIADYSRLPVELWHMIVQFLPRDDQRTILFVSKPLHDYALSLLFSRVNICLGLWSPEGLVGSSFYEDMDEEEGLERQHNITWEILRRISRDPQFAQLVKVMYVRAFIEYSDTVFQFRALLDALESLRNLRALHWFGMGPPVNALVLQTLANASSSTLTELSIPVVWDTAMSLAPFVHLQSLSLGGEPLQQPEVKIVYGEGNSHETQSCLQTIPPSLSRLWTHGNAIWDAPVRIFDNLQDLFILHPTTLNGLGFVLHHCLSLRSFGLLLDEDMTSSLRATFQDASNLLPNLISFKLVIDTALENSNVVRPLVDFLRKKTTLRRLDLGLFWRQGDYRLSPFLDLLKSLTHLEVLGIQFIDLYRDCLTHANMKLLDSKLPLGLTALLLHLDFGDMHDDIHQRLIAMFKKRRKLRYLHILDTGSIFDLQQQLLEDHPPSLELVGYGPYLRWLERDSETGLPAYSPPWKWGKVMFRDVHEFGCEDWEWLLRGRALQELGAYIQQLRGPRRDLTDSCSRQTSWNPACGTESAAKRHRKAVAL